MIILKIQPAKISYSTQILAIQVKKRDSNYIKVWKSWEFSQEEDMIVDFRDWFLKEKDKILIGYNLLKFDLPILLLKASPLEKFEEFSLKLNRSNVLDLFVWLTFLRKGRLKSFEYYCQKYNIENVSEKELLNLYQQRKHQQMEEAIIKNLNAFEKLFDKVLEENA